MQRIKRLGVVAAAVLSATSAQAMVTISSGATANMTCAGGVCAPTAKNAVLNVGDLQTLLASGNMTVTTTGTGVQASDINVEAALGWSSSGTLSLLANKSVTVNNPVSIAGLSALTIETGGKNGTFSFGAKGNVGFANQSSTLTINGAAYALVGNIKTLASDIAANPSGAFALAASYDASQDGTYNASPIPTKFNGSLEGLGNTISDLSIDGVTEIAPNLYTGLFAYVDTHGMIENIGFVNANIRVPKKLAVGGRSLATVLVQSNPAMWQVPQEA